MALSTIATLIDLEGKGRWLESKADRRLLSEAKGGQGDDESSTN